MRKILFLFGILILSIGLISGALIQSYWQTAFVGTSGGLEDPLEAWSETDVIVWQYNSTFYASRNMSTLMVIELLANDTEVINNQINNLTANGGSIWIKTGAYAANVILKTKIRLIIDQNATGITVTLNAGATALLEDYGSAPARVRYWKAGVLTWDSNLDAGSLTALNAVLSGWSNASDLSFSGQLWWNGQNRTDTLAYPFAPYSYEVGVSGSNYYMKNGSTGQVDFWSTNASAVFNNAAGNTSDGSIFVKNSGTIYNITNAIILKNNVSWYSDGAHLRLQNNATVSDTTANIFYDNGLDVANITIDGFEIDGNMLSDNLDIIGTAHCGIGIYARSQGQHITISNNWIHDNRVYGVNIRAGSNKISFDNHIFHNRIEDNGYDGADFFLYDSTSQFYGSSMTNNYVTGMGDIGLGVGLVTGAVGDHMDIDISHNIIEEMDGLYGSVAPAAWIGIRLEDANFSSVSNNIIRGVCMGISDIVSGEGFNTYTNNEIYLKNPNQSSTIKGINILTNNNTITGNLIVSPPSSTWDGLYINANSSIVENNIFLNLSASTGTSTAIYDDSGSYYNRFFKNDVGTCTYKFKRYGTNNVWRDNIGYMTENWVSGANTTATTIVISHGLAGTPQYVFASFNFTGWTSWTWTATSTQITITVTGTLPASYTAYTYTKYDP